MRKSLSILTIALFLGVLPLNGYAATPEECRLTVKAENLEALKKVAPKTAKERAAAAQAELAARKELLSVLVNCSADEALKMQLSLRDMKMADDEMAVVKVNFSNRYGQVFEYYESKKRLIEDIDLAASKTLAKEIKDWRAENYLPLSEETTNLILWSKNQELFTTGQGRLDRVTETVKRFNLGEDEKIAALLKEATEGMDKAKSLNAETKQAIKDGDLEVTSAKMKESLETLSQTYKKFIELSAEIKKLIPL